jgi:dTDP-3-amino-3,6-dideoxy-alpha-D-glucopyranose N,N-dimethyltransferase
MGYSDGLADVYDLILGCRGRGYDAEAAEVVRQIRRSFPGARDPCSRSGGAPAASCRGSEVFDHVEGVEPSLAMRRVAEMKPPSVHIHDADMRELRLGRGFDAVSCLFGPIGYMSGDRQLDTAIGSIAAHLVPEGALAVDRWWFPETFTDGYVEVEVATKAADETLDLPLRVAERGRDRARGLAGG